MPFCSRLTGTWIGALDPGDVKRAQPVRQKPIDVVIYSNVLELSFDSTLTEPKYIGKMSKPTNPKLLFCLRHLCCYLLVVEIQAGSLFYNMGSHFKTRN